MQTLFIGQNRIELASVDSTNNYALQLLKEADVAEGTIVWTHQQTAGRGQRGNQWLTEPLKNLTFSIVLHPNLAVDRQVYLTKVVSLGIAEFVDQVPCLRQAGGFQVKIKRPNDIYVGGKKIAGILIENNLKGDLVSSSVIGIGLNVNQQEFAGLANATSLQLISGRVFDLDDCLNGLCEHIEARYLQLKTNKFALLDKDYEERTIRQS